MNEDFNSRFELSHGLSSYECSVLMSDKFKQFEKLVEKFGEFMRPTDDLKWMVCDRDQLRVFDAMKKQLNDFETMFRTVRQRYSEIEDTYLKELKQQRIAAREQKKDTI